MPYVMIPVPEEHVEEVMQFVLRSIARAAIDPWDPESITEIFEQVDEASRSLLAFVARGSVDGGELDAADAARKIQLTVREATGIMNELNALTRDANRPTLILARSVTDRLPNGRVKEKRVLYMEPEVAEMVREAEKAELQDARHPLGEAAE
jgi:hypothetical protein